MICPNCKEPWKTNGSEIEICPNCKAIIIAEGFMKNKKNDFGNKVLNRFRLVLACMLIVLCSGCSMMINPYKDIMVRQEKVLDDDLTVINQYADTNNIKVHAVINQNKAAQNAIREALK